MTRGFMTDGLLWTLLGSISAHIDILTNSEEHSVGKLM